MPLLSATYLVPVYLRSWSAALARRVKRSDRGQTTAEYGLVILAAGTLALAAILWARNSDSITGLFQNVIDQLTGNISG